MELSKEKLAKQTEELQEKLDESEKALKTTVATAKKEAKGAQHRNLFSRKRGAWT